MWWSSSSNVFQPSLCFLLFSSQCPLSIITICFHFTHQSPIIISSCRPIIFLTPFYFLGLVIYNSLDLHFHWTLCFPFIAIRLPKDELLNQWKPLDQLHQLTITVDLLSFVQTPIEVLDLWPSGVLKLHISMTSRRWSSWMNSNRSIICPKHHTPSILINPLGLRYRFRPYGLWENN